MIDVDDTEEEESSEAWIDWYACRRGDGTRVYPDRQLFFEEGSLVSVDFHQVLDIHREGKKTERPDEDGKILPRCENCLFDSQWLCSPTCIQTIDSIRFFKLATRVLTFLVCQGKAPIGYTGKLSCLFEIISPRQSLLHIDDNVGVCV